jgi:uncharacterized protein YkwD
MALSLRLVVSLATGGAILAWPVSNPQVHAQGTQVTPDPVAPARKVALAEGNISGELIRETEEERQFVDLVNRERRQRSLSQLTVDPLLIAVARGHSAEMREKDYFNHHSPTPGLKTPLDRYLKVMGRSPSYACVGENLFWATVVDVQRGHKAFMDSPTHRENVLFPRFEKIGVGIVKNEKGEFWVTEMFLSNTDPNPSVARRRD